MYLLLLAYLSLLCFHKNEKKKLHISCNKKLNVLLITISLNWSTDFLILKLLIVIMFFDIWLSCFLISGYHVWSHPFYCFTQHGVKLEMLSGLHSKFY